MLLGGSDAGVEGQILGHGGQVLSGAGVPASDTVSKKCPACDNDGWVEIYDDEGFPIGARECPYLNRPFHAPFNATGLLPEVER